MMGRCRLSLGNGAEPVQPKGTVHVKQQGWKILRSSYCSILFNLWGTISSFLPFPGVATLFSIYLVEPKGTSKDSTEGGI